MRLIRYLLGSSRLLLVSALIASAVNGVLTSRIVALLNRSLDLSGAPLRELGVQFALFALAALAFRWFSLAQFVRLSQAVLADLRLAVSRQIAAAPYRDNEERGSARVLALLTEDVGTIGECFMILPWLFVHGVVVVGCLGHLIYLSREAFAFTIAIALLGSLGYRRGARRAQALLRAARKEEDTLFSHFRALFSGAKELKLHARRRAAFLAGPLAESSERVRSARTEGMLMHTGLANWRVLLLFALIGGVLFWLGPSMGLPPDVVSGYALTLLYMMLPINAVLEAAPALGQMSVALERIDALQLGSAIEAAPARALPAFRSLRLSAVTHQYRREDEERPFTLGPLSLELRAGEIVFLVGGNGSGKTTLAKLLTGLYEPESGQISFNDLPIDETSRAAYRECFSAIFSDFHLFDDTIERAGRLDAQARELLVALQLEHKVKIELGRFSTTLLSSGQRRRLALVLAWLEDRPIYVFDEWAADQDPVYRDVFYRRILPALKRRGKAVLAITHDDRYFHSADRCLRLDDGRLSELRSEPRARPRHVAPAAPAAAVSAWELGES